MENTREIMRVTVIGLFINIALAALKLTAGILGKSQAVVADGVHSLSDTMTDLAILIGVRYWSAPPDDDHPHGHQRIETLVTIIIGVILAGVAVGLFYDAVATIHEKQETVPGWIAFYAAFASIVVKELLYRYTVGIGKRIKSSAVVANAWHHRSDMLSSIPTALAVLGARFISGWSLLDRVGAMVVSIFIVKAAWDIAWPALKQLIDTGATPEEREEIRKIALSTDGVEAVHAIRTRYIGSGLQVDLHIEVKCDITVREGHEISGAVKHALLEQGPDVLDVVVHIEPHEDLK